MHARSGAWRCCDGKGRAARVQCELLLAGSFIVLCWTLNLHSYVLLGSSKGFALTGRFKTAKCECLWSSMHCQVRMFVKQLNRRLQHLIAVENKTNLQQPKPSTFYITFHLTLIFYPHHTGMHSQMLYTNGSFEICQERMFVKQRQTHSWSTYLLSKKIFVLKYKSSNLYMICFNSVKKSLIIYVLCIGMRSQMLYTNGSFEICKERMFVKQHRTHGWGTYLLSKKHLCSSKNHQISMW